MNMRTTPPGAPPGAPPARKTRTLVPTPLAGDTKISALPAGATLTGAEPVPVVQGGNTVQIPASAIAGLGGGGAGAPGGSGTQVQYRAGTAFGGIAGSIWDSANFVITFGNTRMQASAFGYDGASAINAQVGTTYTLQASDNGKVVRLTNASPITVICPAGLTIAFACLLIQGGAGQVAVVAGSGATLGSFGNLTHLAGQNAMATVVAPVANAFVLGGQLA